MTALAKTFYLQHEAKTDCSYNNIALQRDCSHFPQQEKREKKVQNRRVYKSTNVHQEATDTRVLLFSFVCLFVSFCCCCFVVGWLVGWLVGIFCVFYARGVGGAGWGGGGGREKIYITKNYNYNGNYDSVLGPVKKN